jgi:hypothetical protein
MKNSHLAIVFVLIFSICAGSAAAQHRNSAAVIYEYFDMLKSGNIETARMLWTPPDLERSSRFGIHYTNVLLKVDCASPIIRNFDIVRDQLDAGLRMQEDLSVGKYARLSFSTVVNDSPFEHKYYVVKDGDWYWLTYPQDYYSLSWPTEESRYFHVRIHPERLEYIDQTLLDEADRVLEHLAREIGLSDADLAMIAEKKIEFIYCSGESDVKEMTGQLTRGLFDLASNDIISATFPHTHELVHLLVNIKLHELPIYTLPAFREGVAVTYGGRWGKDPQALLDLAVYLHREKLVELDSILSMSGFRESTGADISYPVVGLFVSYLIDEMGREKFFELYRDMSGDFPRLLAMSTQYIQKKIYEAAGKKDWADLRADFEKYIDAYLDRKTAAAPGKMYRGRVVREGDTYRVEEDRDWLGFIFNGPVDSVVHGTLLFGRDARLDSVKSALFEEQFSDLPPYAGYRYAVRYDQFEAGLYDYVTNRLLAKYIWGITPSDEYFDKDNKTVAIKFRKDVIHDGHALDGDLRFLPE